MGFAKVLESLSKALQGPIEACIGLINILQFAIRSELGRVAGMLKDQCAKVLIY